MGKWVDLGTLRQNPETKKSYLILDKDVEVFVKGEKVELGQYRRVNLSDPKSGLDTMLEKGSIDEAQFNERLEKIKEKNIRYKLVVPPVKED